MNKHFLSSKRILSFLPHEAYGLAAIMIIIFVATFVNLQSSLLRSRDAQRKSDLRSIAASLELFQYEFSFFPYSQNNKITACVAPGFDPASLGEKDPIPFIECNWGEDALRDVTDASHAPYMQKLPRDPKSENGTEYIYASDGNRFQLFTHLEGGSADPEHKPEVERRNIMCGTKVCNFGVGFSKTPLDKTLEEYENELRQLEDAKK